MSYTIFYRAMFIKMSDGTYIPMIESGDNNVWETNRRRSREWCSCRWMFESDAQRMLLSLPADEIMSLAKRDVDVHLERYVGQEYTKEDVLKDLGYFNCIHISGHSTTSASTFVNFFKSGLRNAITWDDLQAERCSLNLSWYDKDDKYCRVYAGSEQDLVDKWEECLRNNGKTPWVGISSGYGEHMWNKVRERNRKPRVKKELSEWHVIYFELYGGPHYVMQLTSRNLRYVRYPEYAHKYSTRKGAEKAAESMQRRFKNVSNIHVEQVKA